LGEKPSNSFHLRRADKNDLGSVADGFSRMINPLQHTVGMAVVNPTPSRRALLDKAWDD
jgi:hypothetical protein